MRKHLMIMAAAFLCLLVFVGCNQKKKDFSGVYMASDSKDAIILYEDGSCAYLGDKDTTWAAKKASVTITKKFPDTHYVDLYLDKSLSSVQQQSIATLCKMQRNVSHSEFFQFEGRIRVKIADNALLEQTLDELAAIDGVTKTNHTVTEGSVLSYEFEMIDNCLVSDAGEVYVKQGE